MQARFQIHFREQRKAHGERLLPVAQAVDLSTGTYSQLERGIGPSPRIETVDVLAQRWDISPGQLVTFIDWPCWCCGRRQRPQDEELPYGR